MPETSLDPIKFISCSACGGTGRNKLLPCRQCQGYGFGAFANNRFYYFSYEVNQATIVLDKLKKRVGQILNLLAYLLGIIGLLALGWWIYQTSLTANSLSDFFFWQKQDSWLLLFWLSLLADMFVIYRLQEQAWQEQKIPKIDTVLTNNDLPNKWQELKKN